MWQGSNYISLPRLFISKRLYIIGWLLYTVWIRISRGHNIRLVLYAFSSTSKGYKYREWQDCIHPSVSSEAVITDPVCNMSIKYVIQRGALPSELSEVNSFWGSNSSGSNATSLYSISSRAGLGALRQGSAAPVMFIHSIAKTLAEIFLLW